MNIITEEAILSRNNWINKIEKKEGIFSINSSLIEQELGSEFNKYGITYLLNHLRLCGNIPESYHHDSSEEKQYSKYTDILLSFAYKAIGLKSIVITGRSDFADVEGYGANYSFVADAKAFRLSRSAKNQKDFKVTAMDRWKHGKKNAMVVSPIYQLPVKSSQIYDQAITRNVCIFTYSHLSVLIRYANELSNDRAQQLLYDIFEIIPAINPSKNALNYWLTINKTMLNHSTLIHDIWQEEKIAATESVKIAKIEALRYLSTERERLMGLSHDEAITALIKSSKIDTKIKTIEKISDNGLFNII